MMCGMRRKRDCLAAVAIRPTVTLSLSHLIILPIVPDCRFNLEHKKSNAELACGSNRNRKQFGLLFKEVFAEPNSGEVEWEIEIK
jgi:hypothetical protein